MLSKTLTVGGLTVELERKAIRTLRVTVYPPHGRVRVAAPLRLPEASIQAFILDRLDWIRKHQARLAALPQPVTLLYQTGEQHFYRGQPLTLRVWEAVGRSKVVLATDGFLDVYAPADSSPEDRARLLTAWYRARLKEQIPALLAQWEPIVGVKTLAWGVKQMKTRWGTCSIRARRIWLSLELIKKPPGCLEYVLVHELVHLHERLHNARFWGLMDQFMPDWRLHKAALRQHQTSTEPSGPDAD